MLLVTITCTKGSISGNIKVLFSGGFFLLFKHGKLLPEI